MKPALLLVDIQNDFLNSPQLSPAAQLLVQAAARLLEGCRQAAIPVVHIWTTVYRGKDHRMPHWVRAGKWICVAGTKGHATPSLLRPRPNERVLHKTFFSAFHTGELVRVLAAIGRDTVMIAGLYEHACIRTTAIDAYQSGLEVWIAADAVASNDAEHAAISRRYLSERAARYESVEMLLRSLHAGIDPASAPAQAAGDR